MAVQLVYYYYYSSLFVRMISMLAITLQLLITSLLQEEKLMLSHCYLSSERHEANLPSYLRKQNVIPCP